MDLAGLGLWEDEEKRIHNCLVDALDELIANAVVEKEDDELIVSGKLRPLLIRHRKEKLPGWTLHPEASVFSGLTDPKPVGHPDFEFSRTDKDGEQWDYHVECKLIRVKRPDKNHDYCDYYVSNGIVDRFLAGKYNPTLPSGTMIGYVQEGVLSELLSAVNKQVKGAGVSTLRVAGSWKAKGTTRITQILSRASPKDFRLTHLWADLR